MPRPTPRIDPADRRPTIIILRRDIQMNRMKHACLLTVGSLLTLALVAGTATADMVTWSSNLDGATAIPPTTTGATGTATIVFDDADGTLTLYAEYFGLSGPITSAEFFNGSASSNGTFLWSVGTNNPLEEDLTNMPLSQFAQFNAALQGDTLYLVVATGTAKAGTTDFPNGEIRGQFLLSSPVADDAESWGEVKALFR